MILTKISTGNSSVVTPNYTKCNCKCNAPNQPYGKSTDGADLKKHLKSI